MSEPINPVQIEHAIQGVSNRIANSVKVCSDRYVAFLDADRMYDQLFAAAYLEAKGSIPEKKYQAELATADARKQRDIADAAYRYADRQAKALENELRALQSVGASTRAMYQVAGRGEY